MDAAANQHRVFRRLLEDLRPHWRRDPGLPARIQGLFATHREFGSRDRRLYRELLYTTLRHLPWIEPHLVGAAEEAIRRVAWLAADTPATRPFRAAFATGEPPSGDRTELLPAWFRAHAPELFLEPELSAQLSRPPLWIRLQTDSPASVQAEFERLGWTLAPSGVLPEAFRVGSEVDVTRTDAWQEGRLEVQDLGSQLLLATVAVSPGSRWLDACAGAGGKTLQLARLVGPRGAVEAFDIRPAALAELRRRANRGGFSWVRTLTRLEPAASYDGVLIDAPCSGSGTWRRAPHLKWVTSEADVAAAAGRQLQLLRDHAPRVRPGGQLVYSTCSLSRRENEQIAAAFLAEHPGYVPVPPTGTFGFQPAAGVGLTVWPARHDSDGFFVAAFRRR
ncbi:MAG: RsmB/NOP family class I SAM-dependent RNA methyltransferase [Verrucomicrobia bacterium]|nr:RsmB/NOP family class I SAM-dependent RNA methyltransferase [Verrucomicrobiota bacterium]